MRENLSVFVVSVTVCVRVCALLMIFNFGKQANELKQITLEKSFLHFS